MAWILQHDSKVLATLTSAGEERLKKIDRSAANQVQEGRYIGKFAEFTRVFGDTEQWPTWFIAGLVRLGTCP